MANSATDLPLVRLRNGDFVDPMQVRLITAGFTPDDRPYWTGEGQRYNYYVRIETRNSWIMIPCNDWSGAVKYRNTMARLVNLRRGGPPATTGHEHAGTNGTVVHVNGGGDSNRPTPAIEPPPPGQDNIRFRSA